METDPEPAPEAASTVRPQGARRVIATVLIAVTGLLSIVALLGGYVRADLLTTDRYVEIIGPLARNPAIQAQVVNAATAAVVDNVRVDNLTNDALELLRARDGRLAQLLNREPRLAQALAGLLSGLGPLLQNQVESATRRAAERVVQSPRFAELWIAANRSAHAATLAALRDEGGALRTSDGEVRIDISVIVEEVKRRLVDDGFALADQIPVVDHQIVLVRSTELARAQGALRLFDQTAPWLPWVTLAFAVGAVLVAPDRRRALQSLGVTLTVAMVVVALALVIGRSVFLDRVAATSVAPEAAAAVVDAALDPLWSRVLFVFVAAALIALVALLSGPTGGRLRSWVLTRSRSTANPDT